MTFYNIALLVILFIFRDQLADVIQLLRNSANPQVEQLIKMMKKWAKNNKVVV